MGVQPPGWSEPGIDNFADAAGAPLYPTDGAYPGAQVAALNWEASGHRAQGYMDTWYTLVAKADRSLAADLTAAVARDVGRDQVAVVAEVDVFDLPNWQPGGSAYPAVHTAHSIAIVGYDNTATPPTFTYLDTCGRGCNPHPGNETGGVYTIAQSQLIRAMEDVDGGGFIW